MVQQVIYKMWIWSKFIHLLYNISDNAILKQNLFTSNLNKKNVKIISNLYAALKVWITS